MSLNTRGARGTFRAATLAATTLVLLATQSGVHGQTPTDALRFFKNYFVTGDFVVGGVGLRGLGGLNGSPAGIATGAIPISGVPTNADIVAAFLYWQVVANNSEGSDSGATGVTFRGNPLTSPAGPIAKPLNPDGTAPCWSSGGGTGSSGGQHRTYTYRTDVLGFFDVDENPTSPRYGKFIVNGSHQVQVPDSGSGGNTVPVALGASLVVVYRDPTMPLNGIVLYDGGYTLDQSHDTMFQTIKGFYQAAGNTGKITHIVGSGQANKSENLRLPNQTSIVNPFAASLGANWDNPTYDLQNVTVASSAQYGDSVTTSVDHVGFGSFDCLSWSAIIYRTAVADADGDGLVNIWETSSTLTDPNGRPLPDLAHMGANPNHKDLFVELGYMSAPEGTLYGGAAKPAHKHMPAAQALKQAGDAYKNSNPDPTLGINVHFDVGDIDALDPEYSAADVEVYLVPSTYARGGEQIDENVTVCTPSVTDPSVCQFSAYPGTVGWKTGFRFLRDQLIGTPPALTLDGDDPCEGPVTGDATSWRDDGPGGVCERRFDRNRKDIFHYALSVHALGLPNALCRILNTDGTAIIDDLVCQQTNPDFHVPRTNTGIADFPGADLMLSLGGFADASGKPVGTPFMQGSTLMHELGHTFELTHAGIPLLGAGNVPLPQEPNCKPNYLSGMNYLFQLRGLFKDDGVPRMDYSGEALGGLNETSLSDGALSGGARYRTGWYAPQGTGTIGSPATRHCDGSPLLITDGLMVRVDGPSVVGPIDWNANLPVLDSAPYGQDLNFDGITATTGVGALNAGSNDWANLRLNQIGTRRNVGGLSLDVGSRDLGSRDLGSRDLGSRDLGSRDLGSRDLGSRDLGSRDLGSRDLGSRDLGVGVTDEVDGATAAAWGYAPPNSLTASVRGGTGATCSGGLSAADCHRIQVSFKNSDVRPDLVFRYIVYRFRTADPTDVTFVGYVPATMGTIDYSLIDPQELPNASFTYYATAEFFGEPEPTLHKFSGPSNAFPILAVNTAPAAVGDVYNVNAGSSLNVPASGVLTNDTDVDSASLTANSVALTLPFHGALTWGVDNNGSFTYLPYAGFVGTDSFTYEAADVDPDHHSTATVSITVSDNTPPIVTLTVPPPNGLAEYFRSASVTVTVTATDPSNVVSFTCLDNGSPITVSSTSGLGTPTAGESLSVSGEGSHSLSCTATDGAGNTGAASGSSEMPVALKIDSVAPTVTITVPAINATPLLRASVHSSYSCSDVAPASGLATCVGPVASGANIDTATVGPKSFTVTATDVAGNTRTVTSIYTVLYAMALSPLKSPAQQGSAVPINWQLKDALGASINSLSTLLKMESVFNGAVPSGGCVAKDTGTREILYSPATGAAGGSDFRLVSGGYQFNWDTTTTTSLPTLTGKGCYTVLIYLNDRPDLTSPRMTTSVQLK